MLKVLKKLLPINSDRYENRKTARKTQPFKSKLTAQERTQPLKTVDYLRGGVQGILNVSAVGSWHIQEKVCDVFIQCNHFQEDNLRFCPHLLNCRKYRPLILET